MAGTPIDCSCLICSGFAKNDKVVAVEYFIDVGNILGKSWVSLRHMMDLNNFWLESKIYITFGIPGLNTTHEFSFFSPL